MRFIITARRDDKDPSAPPAPQHEPDEALIEAYMRFNEEMHQAGVLVAAEGFNPAGRPVHVIAKQGKRVAIDGPYAEAKELVGGFYLLEVASHEEAVQWALRCPVGLGFDDVLEVRQLTGADDVPPEMIAIIERAAPTWSRTFR